MITYIITRKGIPYIRINVRSNASIGMDWCIALGGDGYHKLV